MKLLAMGQEFTDGDQVTVTGRGRTCQTAGQRGRSLLGRFENRIIQVNNWVGRIGEIVLRPRNGPV